MQRMNLTISAPDRKAREAIQARIATVAGLLTVTRKKRTNMYDATMAALEIAIAELRKRGG